MTKPAHAARAGFGLALVWLLGASGAVPAAPTVREPVTDAMLAAVPAQDWLGYRGNLASWGYSGLRQIDTGNVGTLSLAWTWPLEPGTNEMTPLVHDGVMYLHTPGGAIVALDARSGDPVWEYQRELPADISRSVGAHSRSLALYADKVYAVTGDAHILALDAASGRIIWDFEVGDYHQFLHNTGPLVARGKVFTGRHCEATYPGGCFLLANDAASGRELWRRNLVPRPGEPGDESWKGLPVEKRVHVGAWGPGSYDSELNLLYWGTSVPAPSNELVRKTPGGDVLYSNSTLALDADTGRIVWFHQLLPRDNWDLDHVFERILVDSRIAPDTRQMLASNPRIDTGQPRKLVTGIPGKTGIVWTFDRATGEFLWARETVKQNVISRVDPDSGRVTVNEDMIPKSVDGAYGPQCPSNKGGRNWPVGAYSPDTNALYMPLQNTCQELKTLSANPAPKENYGVKYDIYQTPGSAALGELRAISVETGATLWTHGLPRAGMLSVLTTAGSLVIAGDSDRRLRAFDARTGTVLWETTLHGPVTGTPISFAVDGVQYLAVTAGGGDWLTGDLNSIAQLPPLRQANMLYVFALPTRPADSERKAPGARSGASGLPGRARPEFSVEQAARGAGVYAAQCLGCHGQNMIGTFVAPALTGDFFRRNWANASAEDLVHKVQKTMPLVAPGSLDRAAAVDWLAYWYTVQGVKAGERALGSDPAELRALRLVDNVEAP